MIYGYIRVSSDKQSTENQAFEIIRFAESNHIKIDEWIKEKISSRAELNERKLGGLLKRLKKGDVLITTELSRIGRNLMQIMSILHYCMDRGVRVWTIKDNYRLGADIQSKVLAFAFGLSAEIERNLISQRTKEALKRIKSEGKTLGRPKGRGNNKKKLSGKENKIKTLMERKVAKQQIARIMKVHVNTLRRFIEGHLKS